MGLVSPAERLVKPGQRTIFLQAVKPESVGSRIPPLASDHPSSEAPFLLSCLSVEKRLLNRLKPSRRLKNHLFDLTDILKIETAGLHSVDAHIAHHDHTRHSARIKLSSNFSSLLVAFTRAIQPTSPRIHFILQTQKRTDRIGSQQSSWTQTR